MIGYSRVLRMAASVLVGFALAAPASTAGTLKEELTNLIARHKTMLAAEADVVAARENVSVAWGDWYPTLDVTGSWGYEKQVKPAGTADTDLTPRELSVSVTQQLWDFGSSNSSIRSSRLTLDQSLATREATRQNLLLQGITAHLNLIRANKLVQFAEGSVSNIKRQAELEDARVQRGSGFSTDVLQAKTQLAGANARVIQTKGGLRTLMNRYRAVFYKTPDDIASLAEPRIPTELLPKTLEEAIQLAHQGNPGLRASRVTADLAEESIVKSNIDEYYPSLEAIAEENHKIDQGGTTGSKLERIIKVELSYDFNLGLTAVNTLKAAKQSHLASVNRYGDTRDLTEEQARNAWDNLQTARENAGYLRNQADIAAEFLELARRERQLGNRSLIDVLAGETALINASSDATSAETNVAVAVFTLLNVMGALSPDVVD